MNELKVIDLAKKFKANTIFSDVTLTFEAGKIYGIVGENGSGKTVFLKTLCGLLKPTHGKVLYNGKILKEDFDFLPSVGIIIEKPGFFDEMNGFDNLKLLASIQNKVDDRRIKEVLAFVKLENDTKVVKKYSLGMKQRLGIAQAIMENPDILILDEFSTALDTEGVEMTHNLLRELKLQNKIIIITSHSKFDIETLCDNVYAFKKGILSHG
jgi:ABC-2 type transport system ATP-binding protein